MRTLIDECVDQRLRLLFAGHDYETAAYANFSGLKNGALLAAAEAAGFEIIITTDQQIPYQQNLSRKTDLDRHFVCCGLADLTRLVPDVKKALDSIKPCQIIRVV